jgi:hypothetical protein
MKFPIPFPIPHNKGDDFGELMKVRLHPYLRPVYWSAKLPAMMKSAREEPIVCTT